MNTGQAKQLSLPEILSRLGFEPVTIRKNGNEYWYCSPLREEKEPSFVVSKGKILNWVWNDFGGESGTVVDFIMRYKNYSTISEALNFLEGMFKGHSFAPVSKKRVGEEEQPTLFSFNQQTAPISPQADLRELEFLDAYPIANPIIHAYLEKERGIARELADRYLQEVKYKNLKTGKVFFAFGMKNESGGYEIRVASSQYSFKSALIARDISLIPGSSGDTSKVNVVEGMVDFLSLCAMYGALQLTNDTIILHSLTSYSRAVEMIKTRSYTVINTFLDNDPSGRDYTAKFQQDFEGQVQDQSSLFLPHRDINDAWLANQPQLVAKR